MCDNSAITAYSSYVEAVDAANAPIYLVIFDVTKKEYCEC
jgi:hypothetical protein